MVEANALEITVASVMIMVLGTVLHLSGFLVDAIALFVFMAVALLGFMTVRAIRGRRFTWPWN